MTDWGIPGSSQAGFRCQRHALLTHIVSCQRYAVQRLKGIKISVVRELLFDQLDYGQRGGGAGARVHPQ